MDRWHFRNRQHFCRSWWGDPLEKKQIFEKKSYNVEKLKEGTLWDFPTSILSQKIEGGPFGETNFPKKSRSAEKMLKGGPFGLARYGMLRGKTGKTFLVQFARSNGAIWYNNIL